MTLDLVEMMEAIVNGKEGQSEEEKFRTKFFSHFVCNLLDSPSRDLSEEEKEVRTLIYQMIDYFNNYNSNSAFIGCLQEFDNGWIVNPNPTDNNSNSVLVFPLIKADSSVKNGSWVIGRMPKNKIIMDLKPLFTYDPDIELDEFIVTAE